MILQALDLKNVRSFLSVVAITATVAACTTSPTGKRNMTIYSDAEMADMGTRGFAQIKQRTPIYRGAEINRYVQCISNKIIAELPPEWQSDWEVVVFSDQSANAFALPGRKIGVHTGILNVAKGQDQLAAVIGHEVGHVTARHANSRASTQAVTSIGANIAGALLGASGYANDTTLGVLGAGAQYGILLPFNRGQESEADVVGLDLMAKAGFDPNASIKLWENMAKVNEGREPPEFASTHPSRETRQSDLRKGIPKVMPYYKQAQAQGKRPRCG